MYDNPGTYRIVVQGRIEASWIDSLEGMSVYGATGETGEAMTILEGELVDQAALVGVLNTLYGLRLTIISVSRMDEALHSHRNEMKERREQL